MCSWKRIRLEVYVIRNDKMKPETIMMVVGWLPCETQGDNVSAEPGRSVSSLSGVMKNVQGLRKRHDTA